MNPGRGRVSTGWGGAALAVALTAGAFAHGAALGQIAPPPELNLKGKVRDFIESNPTRTPAHPHFYGTDEHQRGCSSQEAGVNIAQLAIDTTDAIGDTAVFKGDNRGPRLTAPLDPRVAQCFAPVDRFSDWYNDKPGDVNRAFLIDIKFTWNASKAAYEYLNQSFFPIDNGKTFTQLGPNPPFGHLLAGTNAAHNYGFTMEFHANFTYFKGKKQTFSFQGDDDVWVFINGKRVIDLGGIHPLQKDSIQLDEIAASIGIEDSLVYPLDFFFAERHTTTSKLQISTSIELEPLLAKPAVTPGRFFEGQVSVTATHASPAVTLYYTTDGSTPTTASQKYTGPITLSATTTLKVIATRPGWRASDVVTETFTKMETVATPTADPKSRIFVDPIQVTLKDATPGAVIRYTLDGTDPTAASPVYAGPLSIAVTTTLKAKAFLADWVASAVLTEVYTDAGTLVPPVANPGGIGFVGSQTVSLSVPGFPLAEIRFTTDGSEPTASSPLYTASLDFKATTTLKAKAFQKDWKPSQTMVEEYRRLATSVDAVYIDADGNGRIDGAVIHLDIPGGGVPASILLLDPFTKAAAAFPSGYVTQGATPDVLIVRFPDRQFSPGTEFAAGPLGSFPGSIGYDAKVFSIADSVGPVPVKAVSHNQVSPEERPWVDVTFSEPIDLAEIKTGGSWPFDILRGGGPLAKPVIVASIEAVPGQANTYRWVFEADSPAFPVFIDSLVLAAKSPIHDAKGNPGVAGGKKVPVEGSPQLLDNPKLILVTNPIVSQTADAKETLSPEVVRNPFAIVVVRDQAQVCLNCPAGSENAFMPKQALPEWVIKTRYAFQYNFSIFDHLGNYINKTIGQVTDDMIAKVPQDKDGYRSLRFRWVPIASNGAAAGTGAYILKGTVLNRLNEEQRGSQGENQIVRQSQTSVLATFGYLRQN
ncbi:MAG TPA: chitobiase/beta-hexosaminidase C-terminal domain-containing protein [Fibrobacteria bacterium]|nr:chitobiase/beta-hexosaminidase C-terminal domain-containing protein [Fibrobacteria bacterium]